MNRREEAEWNRGQQFEALGLSERFEFLGCDWTSCKGKRVFVRCRICGESFATWGLDEITRHRRAYLRCAGCGVKSDGGYLWAKSPECDKAMEFYQQGHSVAETAEKFGVSKVQINNVVKTRRLTNGKDWREECDKANRQRMLDYGYVIPKSATSGYIQRAKRHGVAFEYGITLKSVIKRYGLRCAICGGVCDLNDKTWGGCGPMYPSVDHVKPMSKGGGHTWDNVQLAHMICNSQKSDKEATA